MISTLVCRCKGCPAKADFTSRNRVTPRSMAEDAGWREDRSGWHCPSCYRRGHGLTEEPQRELALVALQTS